MFHAPGVCNRDANDGGDRGQAKDPGIETYPLSPVPSSGTNLVSLVREMMSMQIEPTMHTAAQHATAHHSADDARRDHAYLQAARERGSITLDEIMSLASGSPASGAFPRSLNA